MKARIIVTLKQGVLDPQGRAIEGALLDLNFDGVQEVRQGKVFEIDFASTDHSKTERHLNQMCEKLLANTVMEDYRIEWM